MNSPFYSFINNARGAIFLILSDNKQAIPNDNAIKQIPAIVAKTIGILNVHFTMPRLLKNMLNIGFITKQLITSPTTVERMMAGINESAVCKMSCFVVNPSDLSIP